MVAIIPAAGRGTRMATVTQGAPKELLRLGRRSVLERVVREARSAGAERVIVVSSREKPGIAEACEALGVDVAIQERPLGVGHAVACAQVEEEALILMGDSVFHGGSPLPRMAELLRKGIEGSIAVEEVPTDKVRLYGIAEIDEGTGGIRRLLEKPSAAETTSRWAVSARYALSGPLMAGLASWSDREGESEIGLTEFLTAAIAGGADLKAVAIQTGQARVDCGSPEEYAAARGMAWD